MYLILLRSKIQKHVLNMYVFVQITRHWEWDQFLSSEEVKVTIDKSRGEATLVEQDKVENVS